ncbi:MAG: hypothetical protein U0V72_08495 [Cytophagales bacterium]
MMKKIILFSSLIAIIHNSCNTKKDNSNCPSAFNKNVNYHLYACSNSDTSFVGVINFLENSDDFTKGTYESSFANQGSFYRNQCALVNSNLLLINNGAQQLNVTITDVSNSKTNGYFDVIYSNSVYDDKKYIMSIRAL